ncbi:2Fe-2S iron-sulfur cluster-binding protein [Haladaptatus sp. NG-SE-30]
MAVSHRVELHWRDGRTELVHTDGEQSILDAAEGVAVGLPFGCRIGACATCTGRLLDGRIEHTRPPKALKSRFRDEGYVLLCIARAREDCRIEVGVDVQTDLVTNPWK